MALGGLGLRWSVVIDRSHYLAKYGGGVIVPATITNLKTGEVFPIHWDHIQGAAIKYGMPLAFPNLIQYCIDQAVIPHPYEEWL